MQPVSNAQSRKNFLKWGVGALSSLTVIGLVSSAGSKKRSDKEFIGNKGATIKMLGEDGKLVEVIQSTLPARRKKISDKELQTWIKK